MQIDTVINISVKLIYQNDEDTLNNYRAKKIAAGYAPNLLVINEVMYNPDAGKPEWIELMNVSDQVINLKDWQIGCGVSKIVNTKISPTDILINPTDYVLISNDSSFLAAVNTKIVKSEINSLGNSSGEVVLYDFRGAVIDSLKYSPNWGGMKGFSLERISILKETNDSSNWIASLNPEGGTPGYENSCYHLPQYSRNDMVINEIMSAPDKYNSEFIEFYNPGEDSVNIGGWKFIDASGSVTNLTNQFCFIPSHSYFVLAADSSIMNNYSWLQHCQFHITGKSDLGLSNSEDLILLKDAENNTIDSVYYSDKWHNKNILITENRSLERINPVINSNDPSNWSTAVNTEGATPGINNSIYIENNSNTEKIIISPNPFSPDNDGFEDFTMINYSLTQSTAQIRMKIFDSQGRLVRTLANNLPASAKGSVIFDGLSDNGKPLRIGIYIIFLEALNDQSGIVETLKSVVVVARKL